MTEERGKTIGRREFLVGAAAVAATAVVGLGSKPAEAAKVRLGSIDETVSRLPERQLMPKGPEYHFGRERILVGNPSFPPVLKLEGNGDQGMAVWGDGFWQSGRPQVSIRPYDVCTGEPFGGEKDPFGELAIDPKITSPREGSYIVTAARLEPRLPIPGFNEIAISLVDQSGQRLSPDILAVPVPEPPEREAAPGVMYEIASGYEQDGNFLLTVLIPLQELLSKDLPFLSPQGKNELQGKIDKLKAGVKSEPQQQIPQYALLAAELNIDNFALPEFGFALVDGEMAGLRVVPLPGNRFAFSYYENGEPKIRDYQNGKFGEEQSPEMSGILKDIIYDEKTNKILVALRLGAWSPHWDILAIDTETFGISASAAFPVPPLGEGESRRKVDDLELIPTTLGLNCLAQINYQLEGDSKFRSQLGCAVAQDSLKQVGSLRTLEGDLYFSTAVAAPPDNILVAKFISGQNDNGSQVPVVQAYSIASFAEVCFPYIASFNK